MQDLRPPGIPGPPGGGDDVLDWRKRDAFLLDFFERHCATTEQLRQVAFAGGAVETGRKKAGRWLQRFVSRKGIHPVGAFLEHDTGRPTMAYGRWCKPGEVGHEVCVAWFEVITGLRVERGVKVGRTEADGFVSIDGRDCYLEVDHLGHQSFKQYREKDGRYDGVEGFILLVTAKEDWHDARGNLVSRAETLRKTAAALPNFARMALITTLGRLRKGEPWIDSSGNTLGF